jgi:hypothetical protein
MGGAAMTIPDWLVVFVWALLAVSLLSTDVRANRWRKRAQDAERALALLTAPPAPRPDRCPGLVNVTRIEGCALPVGHAGDCAPADLVSVPHVDHPSSRPTAGGAA